MLTYKGSAYVTDSVDTLRTGTQRKGWPRTGSQRGSAVTGLGMEELPPRRPKLGALETPSLDLHPQARLRKPYAK